MLFKSIILILLLSTLVYIRGFDQNRADSKNIKFVLSMGAGWNLGNSLDSHGSEPGSRAIKEYETYWGNPTVDRKTILAIRDAGFSTVRIPVTWYEHMDKDGNIDPAWMDRVNEVADYVLDSGMYAIINIHHDNWTQPTAANEKNANRLIEKVWKQIAQRFAGYDEHLIFESMNEPRLIGTDFEWNGGTPEARKVVNSYNKTFVDVVRGVPGNETRYLMITPYGGATDKEALEDLIIPDDENIIVTVHTYKPYGFTHDENSTEVWASSNAEDTLEIDTIIADLRTRFIDNGIPVIIGEFGAIDKNNTEFRVEYTKYFVSEARRNNMMCIWWDDGGREEKKERFAIFDRYNNEFFFPEIAEAILSEYKAHE